MKLSLALSGLFTTSCLWCQGISLAVEARTNEENSSERQVDRPEAGSFRRPVKDIGSGTLENYMTKQNDISVVHKSRGLSSIKNWVQAGSTVSADGSSLARREMFGKSVALNKKGTRLVVGVPEANPSPDDPTSSDGKIEIYDLVESTWKLMQTIAGVALTMDGNKGEHVSITPDGNHIAVHNGGYFYTVGGSFSVYERDDTTGVFSLLGGTISEVTGDDGYNYSSFGAGIELSRNGMRVALGSPEYAGGRGKAYVYEYNSTSSQWTIVFNTTTPTAEENLWNVGKDVSLAADGKSIFVVSHNTADVFQEDSESNWIQSSLPLTDQEPWIFEGGAMSDDGMRVALPYPYLNSTGGTYIFDKVGTDWVLNGNTPLMSVGLYTWDFCGRDVAISGDGTKVIMACWENNDSNEGYAMVYEERESGAWSQLGNIILKTPPVPGSGVYAVAIADRGNGEGTKVAVGSPPSPLTFDAVGSAAVYEVLSTPCVDSIAEMRMETMNMDNIPFFCKWVNKGQGSTCSDNGILESHCPKSCGTCAAYGCLDSTANFVLGGSETTCASLSASDPALMNVLCKKKKRVRTSCRATCGYCGINPDLPPTTQPVPSSNPTYLYG